MYKKIKLLVILRGGYAYSRGYVYCFCQMFQGLHLFKGVRLFRSLEYTVFGSGTMYIQILPDWAGVEIECMVHAGLPKLSITRPIHN